MQADWFIDNVHLVTLDPAVPGPYGLIQDACLGVYQGRICWLGAAAEAPDFGPAEHRSGNGQFLTPGLVDCHSHLVFAGDRAAEFERRLEGESYESIARSGGGILSTVSATRAASETELVELALPRLQALAAEGVCTVEIKSGYGLDLENELKMLRAARQLAEQSGVRVCTTLLAAHAVPPEFADNADKYIDLVCEEILPAAAEQQLADAVDVFCETIGFSAQQCRRVFEVATRLGLPVKGHVEQLSNLQGARLVAEFGGLSVDHIEYLASEDIAHLGSCVAVLLPGAFYTLGETQKPPVDALREHRVAMAVATDLNPGSSPMASLLLNMNMACVLFGLTPAEALAGVTRNAAQALGLGQSKGQLRLDFDADLVLWPVEHPGQLSYGYNLVKPTRIWRGGA